MVFMSWVAMFWFFSEPALVSARQFAEEGEVANALVVQKYSERKRNASGDNKTYFILDLEYETHAGETISLKSRVEYSEYNAAEPGQVIDVTYLRSNPQKIEVSKGSNLRKGHFMRRLMWISVLAVLLGALFYGRRVMGAIRARNHGQRKEVKLIEVRKKNWWGPGDGYCLIWRDKAGREGRSLLHKADKLMGFRPGDTLLVFHGDKRSWWAGDIGDREGT